MTDNEKVIYGTVAEEPLSDVATEADVEATEEQPAPTEDTADGADTADGESYGAPTDSEATNTDKDEADPEDMAEDTAEDRADTEEIASLKNEISLMKQKIAELEAERDARERSLSEISEFTALFPDTELESIPESVWDTVRRGASLSASYALYEKQRAVSEERRAGINAANAARSTGIAGRDAAGEYFSPEEVRRMSRSEVHANYQKIKESMKKWM